ncbi:hypothetical protein ACFPZ0_24595 [Streptomonospora nanhaiensis]|uniref:putative phage holin n=1 Tax=Streptomonospora nanhaiensis TaxID=1323731 RepID=UPI001C38C7A0|nr:hypothetical protein [Streptomonospora nanhaiensis]MBV2364988.1 hypothetical protein [Streptomonospora nanhaiensis]MBX9391308.1 hypothetical protein [Streptomonospora nanhaiensis]
MIDLAGNVVLAATAGLTWVFTILYATTTRFESTPTGAAFFSFLVVCSLILGVGVARLAFGDFAFFPWVRLALYLGILATLGRLFVLFLRAQWAARRARRRGPS